MVVHTGSLFQRDSRRKPREGPSSPPSARLAGSARRQFHREKHFSSAGYRAGFALTSLQPACPAPRALLPPRSCPLLREPGDHVTSAVSSILQYATTEIPNPIFN